MVWDVEKKEVLAQKDMESMPGALAWHTGDKGNTLASIGEDGQIHLWQSVIPPHMLGPSAPLDDAAPKPAHSKEMSEGAARPSCLHCCALCFTSITAPKRRMHSFSSQCDALPKKILRMSGLVGSPSCLLTECCAAQASLCPGAGCTPVRPSVTGIALLQMQSKGGRTRRA